MLRTLSVRTFFLGVAITTAAIVASAAQAATRTWDGGVADDNNWMTVGNWDNVLPIPGADDLVFAGTNDLSTNNNFPNDSVFNGYTFSASAGTFTLAGNPVTLGGATIGTLVSQNNFAGASINGITNSSTVLQTVTQGLTLAAGRHTIGGGTGGLALNPSGGLLRNTGGLAIFTLGSGISTTTITNNNGILGAWATIGNADFARVNGTSIAAAAYTDINGSAAIANDATSNVRINAAGTGVTLANVGTTDINSLLYSDVTAQAVNIGAGNILRLGARGGLLRAGVANTALTVGTVGDGSILTAGGADNTPGELILNSGGGGNTNGNLTVNSVIADNGFTDFPTNTIPAAVSVVKTGQAAAGLGGTNTYTGGTIIAEGRLSGGGAAFGTGPITILPGGQLFSNGTFANEMFIAGTGTTESNGNGAIRMDGGFFNGKITLIGNARIGKRTGTGTVATINGQITGGFSVEFGGNNNDNSDFPIIVITNPLNNYTGDTRISESSRLRLGASDVIPNGAGSGNLVMDNTRNDPDSWAILDLNGFNETVNGLTSNITIAATDQTAIENNLASTTSVLTIGDNNQSGSYNGAIRDFNDINLFPGNGGVTSGGQVAITKIGTGTQTLSGTTMSYTGATTINGGRLNINSTLSGSAVTVNNGGVLGGSGTVNQAVTVNSGGGLATATTLTLNGVTTIGAGATDTAHLDLTANATPTQPSINVTGTDSLVVNSGANTITINVNGALAPATQYTLVDYATSNPGTIAGIGAGAAAFKLGTLPNRTIANLVHNIANSSIDLNVTGADRPKWTGLAGTEWSTNAIGGAKNWKLETAGTATDFISGDNVLFDDTATGTTVDVSVADVAPNTVQFNNSAKNFTITGTKNINSPGTLTKSGTGSVTLAVSATFGGAASIGAGGVVQIGNGGTSGSLAAASLTNDGTLRFNRSDSLTFSTAMSGTGGISHIGTGTTTVSGASTYTGANTVTSGILKLGSAGALGGFADGTAATGTTVNGGTIDINNTALNSTELFSIQGTGAGGIGAIVNLAGGAAANHVSRVVLTDNASIGGTGRWDFRGSTPPNLDLAGKTLTKIGTNQISLVATTVTDGDIVVNDGTFSIETTSSVQGTGTITYNANTKAQFFNNTGTVSRPMVIAGAGVSFGNASTNLATIASPITMNADATFVPLNAGNVSPGDNFPLTLTGDIGGAGSLIKSGVNTLNLTGNVTYAGNTTVNAGTLNLSPVDGSSELADTKTVTVATGAILNLGFFNTDTIGGLILGGVTAAAGTWGPDFSGAQFTSPLLTGSGFLLVTPAAVAGDFNNNGVVDLADYAVWRKNVGLNTVLPNDPTGGTIGTTQYNTWKANFGKTPGGGSGTGLSGAVPEPASLLTCLFSAAAMASAVRRRAA